MHIDYEKHHNNVKIAAGIAASIGLIVGLDIDPVEQNLVFQLWIIIGSIYLYYYTNVSQQRGRIEILLGRTPDVIYKDKEKVLYYFALIFQRLLSIIALFYTLKEII